MTPSPVESGLGDPPADLRGFPAADDVGELHRLSEYPGPWWYASISTVDEDGGGRFDLVKPQGTCHVAESLAGSLVEKLLREPVKVVAAERLQELFHATITVSATPQTADLTALAATGYGLNGEIHSTLDYEKPRRWAAALAAEGFRALRHRLRGDATATLAGRALFGQEGEAVRGPAGMSASVQPLEQIEAERLLAERNVEVRPIPTHVPIAAPPI